MWGMAGSWERNEDARDKCWVRGEGGRRMGATAQLMSDFQMSRVPRSQSPVPAALQGLSQAGPPAGGGAARAAAPAGGSRPDSGSYPAGGAGGARTPGTRLRRPPRTPLPAAAARGLRMKGETPVNSTMSIGQARKMVEQLKIEANLCRIKVSKAAADLMSYCDAHACEDPLITPVPTSENPFREKKFFCALL